METTPAPPPTSATTSPTAPAGRAWLDRLAMAVGPALALGLLGIYLASPEFYLRWVLEARMREYQAVELITTLSGLAGGALLLVSGVKLWRLQAVEATGLAGTLRARSGAVVVLVVGLAAVFFVGEEISWGQTYLQWQTPEAYEDISGETNLHNADVPFISVQGLGSLFLIVTFFGLPLAWRVARDRLPAGLAPAIPDAAVVVTVATAFVWKEFKNVYRLLVGEAEGDTFYWGFVEQMNEHKEMLIAVGLLLYGLYRLRALRRLKAAAPSTR